MLARKLGASLAGVVATALVVTAAAERLSLDFLQLPISEVRLRNRLLTSTGNAARTGRDGRLSSLAIALSRIAPLDPTPYLVMGAAAEEAGHSARATRLYIAALQRDPRSFAAHFMASRERLTSGDVDTALRHMVAMIRQSPRTADEVLPALVNFAHEESSVLPLRNFVRNEPAMADSLLSALASEPAMASRILQIAPPSARGEPPAWLAVMTVALVTDHQPVRAAKIWGRVLRRSDPTMLTLQDPRFKEGSLPAPFGWSLIPSEAAVAERSSRGLDIVTYESKSGQIATQLTVLASGKYHLSADVVGDASLIEWRVACADPAAEGVALQGQGGAFVVTPTCRATTISLWARADTGGGSLSVRQVGVTRS